MRLSRIEFREQIEKVLDKYLRKKTCVVTMGGAAYQGALNNSSFDTGDISASLGIKNVSVQSSASRVSITITQGTSSFTVQSLAGTFTYEGGEGAQPITKVEVTELDSTNTDVIINYWS